ncbi:hypothetical protein E8E11_005501 [Didymella keratinophila]|nr:hypothetical protein E8E11_005501 [Didymella keratinophila]
MAPSKDIVPKLLRISAPYTKLATSNVGVNPLPFVVPKELLTFHSPFFCATLNAIALYVFCETYDVPALKTSTLEYLIEVIEASIKDLPFDKDITYAYQNTPTDSRLCRVLADAFCCWASKKASQIWFVTARSRLYPQPL